MFDLQISVYRAVIHQQGVAHFGYFDARFDEAAFGSTNLKREVDGPWKSNFAEIGIIARVFLEYVDEYRIAIAG